MFHGLSELPAADEALRRQIDEEAARLGWASLHEELARVDPLSAAHIHPNDPQRIQRALEVYRLAGVPLSELCGRGLSAPPPFNILRLVVAPGDRQVLHGLIRRRFLSMLERGLLEEVRVLYGRGDLHAELPSIRAVGYRQVWAYLGGEWDYPEMVERGIISTRQFAKRQYTWLRREEGAGRFASEDVDVLERMLAAIAEWI